MIKSKKAKYGKNDYPIDMFDVKYTSIRKRSKNFEVSGQFETYGEDIEYVLRYIEKHGDKCIWTSVDGDDGDIWIVNGYHILNRICYYITKEDCENPEEQYYMGCEK
jgi:hypothetical protein